MAQLEVTQADVTKLEVDAIANAPIGLGEAVETTAGERAFSTAVDAA